MRGRKFHLSPELAERMFDEGVPFWKYWGERLVKCKRYGKARKKAPSPMLGKPRAPVRMCEFIVHHPDGAIERCVNLRAYLRDRLGLPQDSHYQRALRGKEVNGILFEKVGHVINKFTENENDG